MKLIYYLIRHQKFAGSSLVILKFNGHSTHFHEISTSNTAGTVRKACNLHCANY